MEISEAYVVRRKTLFVTTRCKFVSGCQFCAVKWHIECKILTVNISDLDDNYNYDLENI